MIDMLTLSPRLGLLRWLLRELSTDDEDMIALVASLPDSDDDDGQALLDELAAPRAEAAIRPLRAEYRGGKQLLGPRDALRVLGIPRASFYALLKRGTFPAPIQANDSWTGWPRDLLLEWTDASERQRVAEVPHGYTPFERYLWRKST
jgi:predicted DNA-binding transcriptional regulator AlpA